MKITCALKGVQTEDGLYIDISGEDMGKIIGHHGETLDAMQYLVSLTVNRDREEYLRVTLIPRDTGAAESKLWFDWLTVWPKSCAQRAQNAFRAYESLRETHNSLCASKR